MVLNVALDEMSRQKWTLFPCVCLGAMQGEGSPCGSVVKNPSANARDSGLIPGLGILPGGGNGNTLHYSYLENSMDRGAWRATVHGVAKSQTRLSHYHYHCYLPVIGDKDSFKHRYKDFPDVFMP